MMVSVILLKINLSLSLCLAGPKLESSRRRKMQVADIFSQDMEDEDNENKPRNKKARAGAPPAPDKKSSTAGDKGFLRNCVRPCSGVRFMCAGVWEGGLLRAAQHR